MAQESPRDHTLALVKMQRRLAGTLCESRRCGEAEPHARQALETAQALAEAWPQEADNWREVGLCLQLVGNSINREDPEQAAGQYRQAITIVEDRLADEPLDRFVACRHRNAPR